MVCTERHNTETSGSMHMPTTSFMGVSRSAFITSKPSISRMQAMRSLPSVWRPKEATTAFPRTSEHSNPPHSSLRPLTAL
ncbi:MAG: hypothetical protein J5674_06085, partial [Candidatus Methanomethylophilaceae archaeon]|nr:hypothetical protein [Candidatus Methanomethylophilaceae archaeon]